MKKISADNTANAVEINAFVNNKTGTGSRERGLSDLIAVMGGPIKPDADIALQLTSEKMSYLQHLEIVAIRAAEKTTLRKSACKRRKSSGRNQYRQAIQSTELGDSIETIEQVPSENDTVLTVRDPYSYQPRLFTTMKIEGGETSKFQIDTGVTCNVIRKKTKRYKI